MALSDGPILDAQAGAETFGSALIAALAGVNSVSGPGMLDFLLVFNLPKLVFDDEMCGQALRFVREIQVADDLPVHALIDQLMADQHLIMAEHTTAHWPTELYLPSSIVDRDNREAWTAGRGQGHVPARHDEVERRLAAYRQLETDPASRPSCSGSSRPGSSPDRRCRSCPPAPEPRPRRWPPVPAAWSPPQRPARAAEPAPGGQRRAASEGMRNGP